MWKCNYCGQAFEEPSYMELESVFDPLIVPVCPICESNDVDDEESEEDYD